ncbi:DUF2059 domain-containing protein [Mesorhizobium sp. KR9-304]|uniref:DUF2059 domain-containing protein n=1 Tax=Mesorhizobium sp. KR9-304 TaxID=3156614 RepID=UPI0032B5521A
MTLVHRVRRTAAVLAASAFVALASQSYAQEIAESHLKAARAAITAVKATDTYDMILPAAAQKLKQELIQQNPDLTDVIIATVDEKALALVARRADLEREAAIAYAKIFSEPELIAIAAFYNSDPGKKLLASGPIVAREVVKAAEIWQRGISRDLATEVGKQISDIVDAQVKAEAGSAAPAPAPEGAAPAQEGEAPVLQGLDAPLQ